MGKKEPESIEKSTSPKKGMLGFGAVATDIARNFRNPVRATSGAMGKVEIGGGGDGRTGGSVSTGRSIK